MLITSVLSQRTYPGAGDIDDCWVVSSIQAVLAHWPSLRKPTIPEFRAAAGDPDDGVSDGGNITEIINGITGLWAEPELLVLRGVSWDTFAAEMQVHKIATVAVVSGSLPPADQYGFTGLHQVTIELVGDDWYISNPLAADGSAPRLIGAASLRQALYDYGGGKVFAVIIEDPEVQPVSYITTTILPFGGTFVIPAGTAVTGIQLDANTGRVSATKPIAATTTPAKYTYDATVVTNITRGNPFLRVTSGPLAGWLLTAGAAVETPNAPPADTTPFSQEQLDAAVRTATDPLKAALAAEIAEDERASAELEAIVKRLRA